MIEHVVFDGVDFAVIIRSSYRRPGVHFFTPGHFSQQLGYMQHPAGHVIQAHVHNAVPRAVRFTQEVLILRRGRLRVDFYGEDRVYRDSRELGPGDVILLAGGGHGFEVIEDVEMIEVKQGPYTSSADKTQFPGIEAAQARIVRTPPESGGEGK